MKKKRFDPLVLLLLGVFFFSGWKVFDLLREYRQERLAYQALSDAYVQTLPTAVPTEPAETVPPETAPITVDFDTLTEQYPDVVGWLYCPDTPIDYPVVQAEDNDRYLRKNLDGKYARGGTLFLDYQNAPDFSDWNTFLYGHNMQNETMFGTLKYYKDQDYFEAHPVLWLLTPERDYKLMVVSGFTLRETDWETYDFLHDQAERDAYLARAGELSLFQSDATAEDGEKLLTLSTCSKAFRNARFVLICLLRELP